MASAGSEPWDARRVFFITALGLTVGVGAWLRLHNLGAESLWLDEASSWTQSKDGFAELISRTAEDNYPPLHNIFLFLSINLLGDSEWALRLPSAIFGAANIIAIYWLGVMTGGRVAGLLAAIFLALSVFHIWFSQEARTYALLALAATMFAAACFHFAQSPSVRRSIWVTLAGLALVYSHPFGTLYWLAIGLAMSVTALCRRETSRRTVEIWLASNVVIAVGFAPWAWLLLQRATILATNGFWIPYPTPLFVLRQLGALVSGRLLGVVLIAGIALALFWERGARLARQPGPLSVFLIWALLPIFVAITWSVFFTPVFKSRYVIGSLPAFIVAAAYGFSRPAKGWVGVAAVCAASGLVLIVQLIRYDPYAPRKGDWRSAASVLTKRAQPSDCLVIVPSWLIVPLSYYYRKETPCIVRKDNPAELQEVALDTDRVWAVLSDPTPTEMETLIGTLRSEHHFSEGQRFRFRDVDVIEFRR
jgi:mannosyltransferase